MSRILIKNGRVWDGEKFFYADLLTCGTIIEKIEENISDNADFVYDAKGKTVSSGLVDIHVHAKGIATDSFGTEIHTSSFPFGVTAINNAGSINGDKTILDSFSVKNTVFVGTEIKNNHALFSKTEDYLEKYGEKVKGVKVYFDKTVSDADDITPLKEICDYAKPRNLKVMVHCSFSPTPMLEIINTLSCGDILTHIYHGGENACTENGFEAFKVAKEKGIILDSGFAGHVHTNFNNLKTAIKDGLYPDTISTDITLFSAFKRGGRYGMTMCMNMAETAGLPEKEIFKAVTSSPAKALNKEREWGYLKVGKIADIAVFDYTDDPFSLTDNEGNNICNDKGYKCVLTISDGQVVYRA